MFGGDSLGSLGRCRFADLSPTRNKARHHGALALVAFLPNFLIKARGVVTTLVPALLEVVGKLRSPSADVGVVASFQETVPAAASAGWSSFRFPGRG
jgi:hypothetical protein